MDLLAATKGLLRQYNIRPDKLKSQNFLVNDKIYDDIIAAAQISPTDTVLEIGPGLGFLTTRLLERVKRVVAVEVDKDLYAYLQKPDFWLTRSRASVSGQLDLINKNILGFDETKMPAGYKVVANLPYHLTGKIIKKFLTSSQQPQTMTILVQQEVAERICATAGQHSLLSLSVQYYGQPKIVKVIGKENFWPVPNVDSALLTITNIHQPLDLASAQRFWQVVRIGFSSKRKTLAHNLAAGFKMDKNLIKNKLKQLGLTDKARAQKLSLDDWERLIETL